MSAPLYKVGPDGALALVFAWSCPHGHRFAVDGFEPRQCPRCGCSTLKDEAPEEPDPS